MDLPQAATNRNRTRGAGGSGGPKGGKSGMGQKMGESKHVFFLSKRKLIINRFRRYPRNNVLFSGFSFLAFLEYGFLILKEYY